MRTARARFAVLPVMVAVVALVLASNGCGPVNTVNTVTDPKPLTAPPSLPVPSPLPPVESVTTTTTVVETPVPVPVVIPENSYAVEPVVELGTIEIPKIGLFHTVFQGVTLNNIDHGPSHWPGTALPGQAGNTVFAGHRVTRSRPFRHLDQLEPGDEVIFRINGLQSIYHVTGNLVVNPEDTWIADQTTEATGTLYACHPPGSAAYRYVVRLALVR